MAHGFVYRSFRSALMRGEVNVDRDTFVFGLVRYGLCNDRPGDWMNTADVPSSALEYVNHLVDVEASPDGVFSARCPAPAQVAEEHGLDDDHFPGLRGGLCWREKDGLLVMWVYDQPYPYWKWSRELFSI